MAWNTNMMTAAVRTAGHLLRERRAPPPSSIADPVPGSIRAMTPEWLTSALCRDVPGARVTGFEQGAGSLGSHERRQLLLAYNDIGSENPGLPKSVFSKTLPSLVTRMLVGYMGHARFEMLFYNRIRPELDIETPVCFYSASDKNSFAAVHLLSDVGNGAVFGSPEVHIDLPLAESMVDLLADLHGPFYGSPRLNDEFKWLPDYVTWFTSGVAKVHTDRYHAKALKRSRAIIPPRLWNRRDEIWPATIRGLEAHRDEPSTVLHSDVHILNWYVTAGRRMGLLDWQCISKGHWARDVSYALSAALTIKDRRAWEGRLVARYVTRMRERWGVELQYEESFDRYRQQLFHALTMWTQTLCHPIYHPRSQPDWKIMEVLHRMTTAIDDLDALDSFPPENAATRG